MMRARRKPAAPGERRPAGIGIGSALAVVAALAAAVLLFSPRAEPLREEVRAAFADDPPPAPGPRPRARVQAPARPAAKPQPDAHARPLAHFSGEWSALNARSEDGWSARVQLSPKGARLVAQLWVRCGATQCRAGEFPAQSVTRSGGPPGQVSYLRVVRNAGGKRWTLLLRAVPDDPDRLESWEWFGPPGSNQREQSALGVWRRHRVSMS